MRLWVPRGLALASFLEQYNSCHLLSFHPALSKQNPSPGLEKTLPTRERYESVICELPVGWRDRSAKLSYG